MDAPWPASDPHPGSQAEVRISHQVRRFAVVWLAAAAAAMALALGAAWLTGVYRGSIAARSAALATAEQRAPALQAAELETTADLLRWQLRPGPAAPAPLAADLRSLERASARLAASGRAVQSAGGDPAPLSGAAAAAQRWQSQVARTLRSGRRPGAGGRAEATAAARAAALPPVLAELASAARSEASTRATVSGVVTGLADLVAIVVLVAGGGRLLLRTWRLAGEADHRRERESRWRSQIESVVSWNNRAKSATTREQLLGFASMIPPEAIGAECMDVATGGFPEHEAHGRDRIAIPVDETGNGLYMVVCFAPGRGDQLDHHALELAVGHLAALWRTVLRQEDLERAAGHDALTGLPNRRTFDLELRRRVGLWKRRALGFTLAMIDLDHFKAVNDSFGHPEGDAVLRRAGEAIRDSLRGSDRLFRLGGEEFAVLLETTDERGVEELLERARESVRALGVQPRPDLYLSASVGWAIYPDDADEKGTLVERADEALYRAKNGGRDRVVRSGGSITAPL
jgi:diguanylate cyclase (GGDEF)-like protein